LNNQTIKEKILAILPGFMLAILIGNVSWFIGSLHKIADPLVVGIVLGIIIRFVIGEHVKFDPGLIFAPTFFIPIGIIFYGINLRFDSLGEVPAIAWLQLIVGIIVIFAAAVYLGNKLKLRDKSSLLIATGTAICGASAIVITAPVIKGEKEDISLALVTITVWGIIGVLLYPLIRKWLSMSDSGYALFAATTLHMTGLVKITAALRQSSLPLVLAIKMARTLMIISVVGVLHYFIIRNRKKSHASIPWYLWGFLLVGLAFSFIPQLITYRETLKPLAGIFFTMALASIGLMVNIRKIIPSLGKALILGLISWAAAIAIFLIGNFLIGY